MEKSIHLRDRGQGRADRGDAPVLDCVHLSRQCAGDAGLEVELLALFRAEALALAQALADGAGLSPRDAADLAHRLKGSALAVGAGRVARAAAALEARAGAERPKAVAALIGAVADAADAIDRLHE